MSFINKLSLRRQPNSAQTNSRKQIAKSTFGKVDWLPNSKSALLAGCALTGFGALYLNNLRNPTNITDKPFTSTANLLVTIATVLGGISAMAYVIFGTNQKQNATISTDIPKSSDFIEVIQEKNNTEDLDAKESTDSEIEDSLIPDLLEIDQEKSNEEDLDTKDKQDLEKNAILNTIILNLFPAETSKSFDSYDPKSIFYKYSSTFYTKKVLPSDYSELFENENELSEPTLSTLYNLIKNQKDEEIKFLMYTKIADYFSNPNFTFKNDTENQIFENLVNYINNELINFNSKYDITSKLINHTYNGFIKHNHNRAIVFVINNLSCQNGELNNNSIEKTRLLKSLNNNVGDFLKNSNNEQKLTFLINCLKEAAENKYDFAIAYIILNFVKTASDEDVLEILKACTKSDSLKPKLLKNLFNTSDGRCLLTKNAGENFSNFLKENSDPLLEEFNKNLLIDREKNEKLFGSEFINLFNNRKEGLISSSDLSTISELIEKENNNKNKCLMYTEIAKYFSNTHFSSFNESEKEIYAKLTLCVYNFDKTFNNLDNNLITDLLYNYSHTMKFSINNFLLAHSQPHHCFKLKNKQNVSKNIAEALNSVIAKYLTHANTEQKIKLGLDCLDTAIKSNWTNEEDNIIRYFINQNNEESLEFFKTCAKHEKFKSIIIDKLFIPPFGQCLLNIAVSNQFSEYLKVHDSKMHADFTKRLKKFEDAEAIGKVFIEPRAILGGNSLIGFVVGNPVVGLAIAGAEKLGFFK